MYNILSFKPLLSILSILIIISDTPAQTYIKPGNVTGIWARSNSPYYINGPVTVPAKASLKIEAGVKIYFRGHYPLTVYGILQANGTPSDSILFSVTDSLVGWHGIHFIYASDKCHLSYCIFTYGKSGRTPSGQDFTKSDPVDMLGGAVFCQKSNPLIEYCRFSENRAEGGGALFCDHANPTIINCKFRKNTAYYCGGAIGCGSSKPVIRKCIIVDNIADRLDGGGIALDRSGPVIDSCLIARNSAVNYGAGGIVCVTNSHPTITNCIISDNAGYGGGGIQCIFRSHPKIINCMITRNYSKYGGGLECNEGSNPQVINTTITNNSAEFGGGISLSERCDAQIRDCKINKNFVSRTGGGLFVGERSNPQIIDSHINYNQSNGDGGGISSLSSDLFLENVQIAYNKTIGDGGGIYLKHSKAQFNSVNIKGNQANQGGGMYIRISSEIKFSSNNPSTIHLNFAGKTGNDLFAYTSATIPVNLDTFTVMNPGDLQAYPVNKFKFKIAHAKLEQVEGNLYVSPYGDDSNDGLSSSSPLKNLLVAFSKVTPDSLNPPTIYLGEGEYDISNIDLLSILEILRFVSLSGVARTDVYISANTISVSMPWWKTNAAFALYIIFLISIASLAWRVKLTRERMRQKLKMQEFEATKLKEMDHMKSRFFANISHEFRTPLTLILGPVQSALAKIRDVGLKNELNLVLRNATRLERLVNQLLDLSRLEAGKMNLEVEHLDIIPLLRKIVLAFTSWAERKKISLKFKSGTKSLFTYIDKDKIEKIINNLLSNAFKFTPEGGRITVAIASDSSSSHNVIPAPFVIPAKAGIHEKKWIPHSRMAGRDDNNGKKHSKIQNSSVGESALWRDPKSKIFQISLSNTGPGIPADKIDKIFDRFYQVDDSYTRHHEGTGIGLSLVKELVELHHGTIDVQCKRAGLQSRTTFTVLLPLNREQFSDDEIIETPSSLEETTSETIPGEIPLTVESEDEPDEKQEQISQQERPLILLIEDNPDMRTYIRDNLQDCYRVIEAVNGRQGKDLAFKKIPDLVLSDIMMPEMDGFQVCEAIKSDMRTSHIPVILLTARAEIKDKLKGLERGADDYISKPFVIEEIKVRVKNLIEQRQKLRERFSREALFGIKDIALNQSDEEFLHHAMEMINEHIDDPQYTVQNLGESIGMSRMTLHLKLKALTDQSPHNFIRLLRLKKAAVLLKQKTANVTEVAYEVGFKNLSHFAKAFQEQFGETPSHFSAHH